MSINIMRQCDHVAANQFLRDMCMQSKESGLLAEAYKASIFDMLQAESAYHTALANASATNERVAPLWRAYEDSIEYQHDVLATFAV